MRPAVIPPIRIYFKVTQKLIPPKIELKPAKCKLKIKASTEAFGCPTKLLKGGYNVHPAPTPPSITVDNKNKVKE